MIISPPAPKSQEFEDERVFDFLFRGERFTVAGHSSLLEHRHLIAGGERPLIK